MDTLIDVISVQKIRDLPSGKLNIAGISRKYITLSILTPQECLFREPIHTCYTGSFTPSIGGSLGILRETVNIYLAKLV